ncbi:hypothetical protein [Hymenobacter sp. BT730]|uniref:hypothetical protein n=1 Tax=Hymenobacter sp. BT730 TaxID=3063332 RepID=UPI0026DF39FE|nr:hypothetical protein [Hymenobacter sp. BT730]
MQGAIGTIIIQLLRFALYLALQVFVVSRLAPDGLFGLGWCFLYLGFLLFLPINTPIVLQLVLGFIMGISLDIFFDTGGVHAVASVLVAYLRPWVLRLLTPRDGYDAADSVNIHRMGWQWFVVYTVLLLGIHHAAFFFVELGGLRSIGLTLGKIIVSTLFTGIVLLIIQLVFFSTRRSSR